MSEPQDAERPNQPPFSPSKVNSNRVGELNLDWDAEVIAGLNIDLSKLWSQDELAAILKKAAGGAGAEPDETELCPTCGRPMKARKREAVADGAESDRA